MAIHPPNPPEEVRDLHSQPGLESDGGLLALQETLESDLPRDVLDQLTQFVPDDEIPAEPTAEYRERALEYVNNCIAYREDIRPDSLREWGDLSERIDRVTVGNWVQYFSGYDVEHDSPESDADTLEHGKYLFFSPDSARELEDIVIEQFQQRPYRAAKIPTKPGKDEDWVLCLYQNDNRYWYDLRGEYHNPPTVRFRGFKTERKNAAE
jgi:hypothetical protein